MKDAGKRKKGTGENNRTHRSAAPSCLPSIGGGTKPLLLALFAGCVVFTSASAVYADENSVTVPALDKLHNSGTLIPGTQNTYPASEYTLTEVEPADIENLAPNVIKIYDPNSGDSEVHYYEIGFKNPVYGEGTEEKYYIWSKDAAGVKLVETQNSADAVLTLKYTPGDTAAPVKNSSGQTIENINEIYIEQDIKNIISAGGTINNLSGVFKGNSFEITNDDDYNYSAIISEYGGNIKNINSSFIGNTAKILTDNKVVYGAFIKDLSNIENIYSEFIANNVQTNSAAINGGLLELSDVGKLSSLTSDFMLNGVNSVSGAIEGVVLANDGTIANIDSSRFIDNYGISESGNVSGGAIYNSRGGIDKITNSLFEGNYAISSGGTALGGAIYNINRIDNIENSIFTDNYASSNSGKAQGGAIYTDSSLKISAADGKLTEFTNNYIINNGVKENQAIYVSSDRASLTFEATNGGRILLNDIINGAEGYNVKLTGDGSGKISIYNQILNADIEAMSGADIDFADGVHTDYNFLTMKAGDGAVFSIDADFTDKTSDTLTLGVGSQGIIYIDDLNITGDLPAEGSVILQILTAPDRISIGLTDELKAQFNTREEYGEAYTESDQVKASSSWSDEYNTHTYQDYIQREIKAVTSGANRTGADSIEYSAQIQTDDVITESMGDTLKLLTQDLTGTRNFNASSADETYTLSENSGTITSGAIRIYGVRDSATGNKSTIDAGNYSLVQVGNGASATYDNININSTNTNDGSILTIDEGGTGILHNYINITSSAEYGIVNDGTLTLDRSGAGTILYSNTGITGNGTLNLNGYYVFTDGASIVQDTVNFQGGSSNIDGDITANNVNISIAHDSITLGADSVLTAELLNMTNGNLYILADNLNADTSFSGGRIYLGSGTLSHNITGVNNSGGVYINGDVINNAVISRGSGLYIGENASFTTNADNLQSIVRSVASGGSLNLTGGTVTQAIYGTTNVLGDVTLNARVEGAWTVAEGASITTDGGNIWWSNNMQNSGTVNITGGSVTTNARDIVGGVVNILGDTTFNSYIVSDELNVAEGAALTIGGSSLRADKIVNDGVITVKGGNQNIQSTYVLNPITGSGYMEFASGSSYIYVLIDQEVHILDGGTLINVSGEWLGADVTVNEGGTLQFEGNNTLSQSVTGDGRVYVHSNTTTNEGLIDVAGGIDVRGNLYTDADKIGNSEVRTTGLVIFTGGTIKNTVSGTGYTRINTDSSVISEAVISTTNLELYNRSTLTIDADNILSATVAMNAGSNLILGDGTIDYDINGGANDRTVTIAGNVKTSDRRINPAVVIQEGGVLTTDIDLLRQNVTNNGDLYLTGYLGKKIRGTGTTHITGEGLAFNSQNASIDGTLDLNNGIFSTAADNTARTYNINKLTGKGDFGLDVNLSANQKSDRINITDTASDGILNIAYINLLNMPAPDELKDYGVIQILYGGSGAQLTLDEALKNFSVAVYREHEDTAEADVFFDTAYNKYFQNGVVTGNIALATTESTNDSIHVNNVITQWGEEQSVTGNLLAAWNQLSTEEEKFFRFRTANDVYTVPSSSEGEIMTQAGDLGTTASGTLNIVGVAAETAEGEPEQKSVIDMHGASGFDMTNANTKINISDVTIENANIGIIRSTQATNSIGTIDEEGHVSGGIDNVSFVDNSRTILSSSSTYTGIFYFANGTISQILDSEFKNNSAVLTNTDSYSNPYLYGGTLYLSNTDIGSAATGEGGIINTVFEGNSITLNGSTYGAVGSAIFATSGTYIENLKDSVFKNNVITSANGAGRGTVTLSNSTIHNIENTDFINNRISAVTAGTRGGALLLSESSATVGTIKDSLFDGNSVYASNSTDYQGGAIYSYKGTIGEIINTTFSNNSAYSGGAMYMIDSPADTLLNISDSEFTGNTAMQYGAGMYFNNVDIGEIKDTDFTNNTIVNNTGGNLEVAGSAITLGSGSTLNSMSGLTFTNNGITTDSTGNKYGGAVYMYGTPINSITDSAFTGNYIESAAGSSCGGAFNTRSGKIGTMSGLTFDSNYSKGVETAGGAIYINAGTTGSLTGSVFTKNYTESSTRGSYGGALYLSSATIEDKLDNLTFENNYTKSNANNANGGAVGTTGGKIENFTNSTFTGNYAEGNSAYGGALRTERTTINNIEGLEFNDNYAKANNGTIYGGAMYAYGGTIKNFKDVTFTNNHGEATGVSFGGALHVRDGQVIENFENVTFENNYALSTNNDAQGGALYISGNYISNGIVNSSFINNYVDGKSTNSHGGAILVGNNSLAIIAKDNGLSEFTGNYRIIGGDETTKENEAIFVWDNNLTLTLNANTGGTILMNDIIRGGNGTQTAALTGDSTGVIKLFNHIDNMKVSADNVNIETADGKTFDYDFNKLTSEDTAKFKIDFDRTNAAADNFTVGTDSSGVLYIDSLNVLGSADENKTVQILKAKDDKIQLALNSENIHLEQDLILNLGDTVYNDAIYHQNEGYTLATTATTNDSITYLAEKTYDGLDLITKSTLNEIRNFIFNNTSNYLAAADISDAAAGTLNITGIEGETLPLIDFNGHKAFTLTNESTLNITDTQLANAKDNTVINIQNENAQVNIDNAKINGNITASGSQSININGNADFAGTIQGAQVVLNDGTVSMEQNTFQNTNSFTANAGRINLANDITGENYRFSDLTSAADTGYIIDLDVENKLSDTITVQNGSGIITIDEVNYLNTPGDRQEFTLKILDTPDDSIQLAIAEDLENLFYQEISRVESDKIQENTGFSHIYYDRERKGELQSQITLATTTTTNDSINFSLQEVWEDSTTIVNPTGDTLKLVAGAENIDNKTFSSQNAAEIYQVTDDIGKIAQGEFDITGTSDDGNMSTINFNDYKGLEVGENSTLAITDTRLTGSDNVIHVTDSTGVVELDGAVIDGDITGDEKYNLVINSNHTTTVNGNIENADVTYSKGNLIFAENTFAADNTTLNVTGGQVSVDNSIIEQYVVNNLQSSTGAVYSLDVDLSQRVADTITVGADSAGPIVLSAFNMIGVLEGISPDETYTIKILNAQNDNTYLDLSDTIKSQLAQGDTHLGYERILLGTDPINAHSSWDDIYNIKYQNNEIRGELDLFTQKTKNDSIYLYNIHIGISTEEENIGDTLKLVNQLDEANRSFKTDDASKTYQLSDNIGSSASGTFDVTGAADENGNISAINMNRHTGFVIDKADSVLNISNIKFQNLNFADNTLIDITNENGTANLNNVTVEASNNLNAINNDGSLNMTGGNVVLNSGITGAGNMSVTGDADVKLSNRANIVQNNINVIDGSLTIENNSSVEGALNIDKNGSVTTAAEGITSDVANGGNITFTGGTLTNNVTGGGTTNIKGEVVNNAQISNNVDIQSGKLTSGAEQITGSINNDANLVLDGNLNKTITGNGTTTANKTLTLAQGAGIDGTLDLNNAAISTTDSFISDYEIGTMKNNGSFSIDADFATGSADKFITGNTSSGTIYIDSINFANLDNITDSSIFQILDSNGTNSIQLALSEEISSADYIIGRTQRKEQDNVLAVTEYTDIYKTYQRGGDIHGSLALGQTSTENDSIVVTKGETVWDENRSETGLLGDTLALWNQLETEENKEFNFDKTASYTAAADLGSSNGTNLTINGVSESETSKSEINLNKHSGFVLDEASNLTINNTKLTGNEERLITVSNADANINLNNAYIDGNIEGSSQYDVIIEGNDVTTLNGDFKNASATLNGGGLKFNADTFADSTNKLTAQSGAINLSDNQMTEYHINELNSSTNAGYTLDIDFANKTSDKITAGENSTGKVTITGLNILGEIVSDKLQEDYKIQILDVPESSDLQLALSQEIEQTLGQKEYLIKTEIKSANTEVEAINNWTDKYYQNDYTVEIYGKLGLATTKTENDSIGINITRYVDDIPPEQGASMGDTLALVNKLQSEEERQLNFDAASNIYEVGENLGETTEGTLSINGVSSSDGNEKSTVDLNGFTGFELANDTDLNLNDIKFTGNDTLVSVSNENAQINIKDSYIDGNLTGTQVYDININGEKTTTLNGTVTTADTILSGGGLRFNTDTFKDTKDTLTAQAGNIYLDDDTADNYTINELNSTENVNYAIDINVTDKTADKLTLTSENSKGTVLIDNINFINQVTPSEEFKLQILDSKNNSIQLALSEEIKNQEFALGEDSKNWNDLNANIYFDEQFHDYTQTGTKYGKLNTATSETDNDSIALTYSNTVWNDAVSTARVDTLKELNVYETTENKNFNFKNANDNYTVKEDLGSTTEGSLNINGVSESEELKSTINLDKHSGFNLANDTTLNISDAKLTGNQTALITVANENAQINLKNANIDGNITGSQNFNVQISGESNDITSLGGQITNANTTMTSGTLKFETDTFADTTDTLNIQGGKVSLDNGTINSYEINNLTSAADANYSLDIDLTNKLADTIKVTTAGKGTITIDSLNISGSVENPSREYKIQILETPTSDLQLALGEELKGELDEEYLIGSRTDVAYDTIKEVTNWKDIYNKSSQLIETFGKLALATTDTENDSLGIIVSRVNEGSIQIESMGDTLHLVNNSTEISNKIFEFDTSEDEYKVSENLGQTSGTINITGITNDEKTSTIDMNGHSGFELGQNSGLNITNTQIKNATAAKGSVIYSTGKDAQITLTNINLTDNKSTGQHGAAIYSESDITINTDNGNTTIKGNKTANDDEAVYLTGAKLTLNTVNNGKTYINDKINGDNNYKVAITGDKSGEVYLSNRIKNSDTTMDNVTLNLSGNDHFAASNFTINSGTLNLVNDAAQEQTAKSVTINGSFNLNADVDLENELMDRLPENTVIANPEAYINVDKLNLISDTKASTVEIPFAYAGFKDNVKYIGPEELSKDTQVTTLFAPVYKYSLSYDNRDDLGYFVFTKGGGASPSTPGAFNPSVLASPVAAQAGGFAAMNETFNYAFKHSDYFSMLPPAQRLAAHYANRYAIDGTPVHSAMKDSGIWFQPYANFESISLDNGPSVDVTSYGSLVGGDSEYHPLKNGWGTVTTAYVGYNGSYQSFSGVSTTQNGGVLGLTQTFYKDKFFTALTASAGASVGNSNTMYGNENFAMLMSGVASKTGYNFEFKEGKYILQPSMMMSYTYVNTFDYTNAAGVGISSDPLHTLQLHPNIKFAANLKNGWQPYAFAGMVWNIMNNTQYTANNIVLPSMSIKPYVEYGIGVQKTWKDSITGYLQTMIRNGGRNGVALSFGFRWTLGKNNNNKLLQKENPTVVKTSQKKIIKQLTPDKIAKINSYN